MKFNCGLSPKEKDAARWERVQAKVDRLSEWHRTFAWFPVRVGSGDCRWLEFVERRYVGLDTMRSPFIGRPTVYDNWSSVFYRAIPA